MWFQNTLSDSKLRLKKRQYLFALTSAVDADNSLTAILSLRLVPLWTIIGRIHSNVRQVLNCECLTGKIHSIIGRQLSVQEATSVSLLIMLLNTADNNNPDMACSTVFIMG